MKFIDLIVETVYDVIRFKKLKYVFILLVGIVFGYAWAWLALN